MKDGFHRYVVEKQTEAINPKERGTKFGLHYDLSIEASTTRTLQIRFCQNDLAHPFNGFRPILNKRKSQADDFYEIIQHDINSAHAKSVQRQALAGMLWSKQLYYYDVSQWLKGDPAYLSLIHI